MTDVSPGFRPPCWCPSRWAPTWRLHTNLYKFGKNVSPHIFHKKNSCDLNLGESLCISTFFLFPDSGLNLLNDFDFLFWSILNGVTLKTTYCLNCPASARIISSLDFKYRTSYNISFRVEFVGSLVCSEWEVFPRLLWFSPLLKNLHYIWFEIISMYSPILGLSARRPDTWIKSSFPW